ncbi:2-hydroxyacyl-CoA dehydratase subunit D [Lacrimispora sp. 38-1]|uniref:2-hydroxyacyl-CoA dehydratase subunit D n=1 Tax=Lacrimispora sp. 38-1 TaxID=3125778 RepID=UPI003CF38814
MKSVTEILEQLKAIAENPRAQKDALIASGKKVVLTAPVYTPEELVHSLGMVPMGAWGGDIELREAKRYFPAFICSIVQSLVELGIKGVYDGVSAVIIPSLCDSLKVVGENWKYAIPNIPFLPMTYPQNRKPEYGKEFTKKGYERMIEELEKISGETFDDEKLAKSIRIYNEHNTLMRELSEVLAEHPEVTAAQRSAVFKSAFFMLKEEHSKVIRELLEALKEQKPGEAKIKIMTTGILADSPSLLNIIDSNGLQIVADDVAAESRQYRTDALEDITALDSLSGKFCAMDHCSVLYDVEKKRIDLIVETAKSHEAKGVLVVLTKFCDPEEFDYPLLKKACDAAGLPIILIEVDRQMENYEQAGTMIETFKDMLGKNS